MTQITSHILDTSRGKPAEGVLITLMQQQGDDWLMLGSGSTDADFSLLYDAHDGNGWIPAWTILITGNNPAWEDKPWGTAEVGLNVPGDVDLKWRVVGYNGILLDNVYVAGYDNFVPFDSDGDGLPNTWETLWFGTPTGADASVDSESPGSEDGIVNTDEYVLGYNPLQSNLPFRVEAAHIPSGVRLTFGETTDARLYAVEYSTDLTNPAEWQSLEDAAAGSNGVTSVTDTSSDPERGYRIEVTVP